MPDKRQADQPNVAQDRVADIAAQFPELLDQSELDQISQRVTNLISAITTLRATPLENSDELATAFRPIGKEQT